MTFVELARLDPRLGTLERDIRRVRDDRRKRAFCANEHWYRSFKPRLLPLVGWDERVIDERLRTPEAYDVAYQHLYRCLPDCRNCLCG